MDVETSAPSRSPHASRRGLLAGSAAVAGGVAATSVSGRAVAATSYTPARFPNTRLLDSHARHLASRFSYGVTPALAQEVRGHGGARSWFEWQLDPTAVPDGHADRLQTWFPALAHSPSRLWQDQIKGVRFGWQVMNDYCNWLLLRRMTSRRQVLEVMTEFWENHFNVPANGDGQFTWRMRYGDVIRTHALDSFEALLQSVTTHPAMGIYLDNAVSDKKHPNENLGRELLELHTVGVGNYTEKDVKSSARILTGWVVDEYQTWAASYDKTAHWTGRVKVGSFHAANRSHDGRAVTTAYLSYLAHHPDTAHRIAWKLATVFVRDNPPAALVDHLAKVYLKHGTQIRPVLRALVDSKAFASAGGAKVRDPEGDVVATYRMLGVRVGKPSSDDTAAHQIIWQTSSLGAMPVNWPQPNGQPIDNASWSSPSRLLGSMQIHYTMSGGWWPNKAIRYREPVAWLPKPKVRFDALVDHMSQELLHRHSTPVLLKACCEAVAVKPHAHIDKDHPVVRWLMPRLLTTFLDSPAFFGR